jgi:hypothetical protein
MYQADEREAACQAEARAVAAGGTASANRVRGKACGKRHHVRNR